MQVVIDIQKLTTGYHYKSRKTKITSGIDATLQRGELVCLIGPNGAGKSTLMRTISGEQKPLEGQVFLDGKNIHALSPKVLAKKLSLVLTERVSAGMLTAYEVVALGRYPHTNWSGQLTSRDHQMIQEAIGMAGAEELAARTLTELSDGERQKIMVARAFAQEPEVMILDEVTAFLDLPRRVEIMKLLKRMAREAGKSILLSTHDMDLALRSADRIWLLPKEAPMVIGAPEDLVLDGSFQSAFQSEGVQFDPQNGSFQIQSDYHTSVHLEGDGNLALWTQRALDRNGIRVDNQAETQVVVAPDSGKNQWIIREASSEMKVDSLLDLITVLRREP